MECGTAVAPIVGRCGGNGRARPLLTGLFGDQDATVTLQEKVGSVFPLLCSKIVHLLACPACHYL